MNWVKSMSQAPTMKIGILGLENAGKTSLIRTLHKTYHIGDPLSPTKNIDRSFFSMFGEKGTVWDFGGQSIYRDAYLKHPDRFLSGIQYLFYVIDIQDTDRFPEALQYFKRVYEFSSSHNPDIMASILFHKTDPALQEDVTVRKRIDTLKKEIHRITDDVELAFFETTAFDPLSVLNAISLPILGDQPIYNSLSLLFANFSMNKSIEYMSLLVEDLLEIGSFRLRTANQEFLDASMAFYKNFFTLEIDSSIRSYLFEGYRFSIIKSEVNDIHYTLNIAHPILSEDPIPTEQDIESILPEINAQFDQYNPRFF